MDAEFWNKRYAAETYAYGTEPNDFLREHASVIPTGKVLSLAEGEGRNAVYLASLGYQVTGVDQSDVAMKKALALATEKALSIAYFQADLTSYDLGNAQWSGVIAIWAHFAEPHRSALFERVYNGLVSGGVFLFEGYSPAQLAHGTGGPKDRAMLTTLHEVVAPLKALGFAITLAQEVERDVQEGTFHSGKSAAVQVIAKK